MHKNQGGEDVEIPENEVGLQEHAAARDHPGQQPPEVADGVEGPWHHLVAVGALQQRAGQPLVLGAACAWQRGTPSAAGFAVQSRSTGYVAGVSDWLQRLPCFIVVGLCKCQAGTLGR